jgi:hypothetical protein
VSTHANTERLNPEEGTAAATPDMRRFSRDVILIQIEAGLARAYRAAERVAREFTELHLDVRLDEFDDYVPPEGIERWMVEMSVSPGDDIGREIPDLIPAYVGIEATEYRFEWEARNLCKRATGRLVGCPERAGWFAGVKDEDEAEG